MSRVILSVRMEVEVDAETWSAEYGTSVTNVTNDVEDYLLNQIAQSVAAEAGALVVTGYAVEEA